MKSQNLHRAQISIALLFLFFIVNKPNLVFAATSENGNYTIDLQDINADIPEPTKKPIIYPLQQMQPLNQPTQINASNYIANSSSDAFSFSLLQLNVDFSALTATNPVIRTSQMILASPLQGAQVLGSENRPMTATDKQFVPDTTCDNGLCTAALSSSWESALTYGFGYRCESETKGTCDETFANSSAFKQFANPDSGETMQQIIKSGESTLPTKAKIIYKINISGTQPLGGYRNTITYIAVPNF